MVSSMTYMFALIMKIQQSCEIYHQQYKSLILLGSHLQDGHHFEFSKISNWHLFLYIVCWSCILDIWTGYMLSWKNIHRVTHALLQYVQYKQITLTRAVGCHTVLYLKMEMTFIDSLVSYIVQICTVIWLKLIKCWK